MYEGREDGLLARVFERLDALEQENEVWRAETARLARELSEVTTSAGGPHEGGGGRAAQPRDDGSEVSRRGMLRLGAAAAAGAAATAGGLVGASPALAGTDGDLTLASVSNSAAAPTGLAVTGSTSNYGIGVTDNGLSTYPSAEPHAALFGHARNANFQSGVVGYSDNGMSGVVGRSDPIDTTSNPGISGVGQPGVFGFGGGTSAGVLGTGNGTGVAGIGIPGVHGTADGYSGTGVQGTNPGTVLGSSLFPAQGVGVLAECTDGGAGPPAAASVALSARNDGSGTGVQATSASGIPIQGQITTAANAWPVVYATTNGSGPGLKSAQSGTGYGVYSQIANTANSQPAVYGSTNGTGPALRGSQSGKSGSAVSGQVSNSKNTSAAILGTGSSKGRGGQFAGGVAQVRLVPGGSRPTSGQTGDLFVDSSGHLHYCKTGGSTASWVQLA
jgi:hypothetical protein